MLPPTKATLSKYGLTADDWLAMYRRQRGKCAVCKRTVDKLVVDHEHIPRYRHLPPAERKRHVRGLLCVRDNWRYLPTGLDGEIAKGIARYLSAYEKRRDNGGSS